MSGPHRAGRWSGGVIFLIGLAMLVGVFSLAVVAFLQVPEALAGAQRTGRGLGWALAGTAAQVGFLIVMAYAGSLISSKGLELYGAARQGPAEQ